VKCGAIGDTAEFIKQGCPLVNVSGMPEPQYRRLVDEMLPDANKRLQQLALADFARTGKMRWTR
jgi:hypothetical protein